MDRAEIHNEIESYTEMRAQSMNQTNMAIIASLKEALAAHEESERKHLAEQEKNSVELRLKFYEEMKDTVKKVVQETVNGKIDRIQIVINSINQKIDDLKKDTDPIIEEKKESEILHKRVANAGDMTIKLAGFFVAISAILATIWAVFKYIILEAVKS